MLLAATTPIQAVLPLFRSFENLRYSVAGSKVAGMKSLLSPPAPPLATPGKSKGLPFVD